MRELYPEFPANAEHFLATEEGHEVRWETSGNPKGLPVIFLHGGPGSGCKPDHRRFFDPARYHVILMDQRGCNLSRPFGELEGNSTQAILRDMEAIREALGLERWVVFGGSWGATLTLLYAETHPERVAGLVLRGTFLARRRDLDWYVGDGLRRMFPEAWEQLDAAVPQGTGFFMDRAAEAVLEGPRELALAIARAWERYTGEAVGNALPQPLTGFTPADADEETLDRLLKKTGIEMHYARNRYFLRANQLLDDIGRIPEVPTHIIHGRRDVTCLPDASWAVHKALPHSTLTLIHDTGHLANEPGNTDALVRATDAIADALGA